ncbi:MAG: MFS transporter [Breznakibacter sp.]|nr:MFS transporter [Breznakibacter sp.]
MEFSASLRDNKVMRWSVLAITSLTLFASYFFTDVLSPLEDMLIRDLHWDGSQYGFFSGQYSFLNIIGFIILGGVILDRLGIRRTGLWFTILMLLGASVKYYALTSYFNNGGFGYDFFNSFWVDFKPSVKLASLGFMIFGLGSEMAGITLTKVVVKWFKGKELALAMGLQVSVSRIGTAAVFVIAPAFAKTGGLTSPVIFGLVLIFIGLLSFIIYMIYDLKLDNQVQGLLAGEEEIFRWSDMTKVMANRGFVYISMLCVLFYACVFPFLKFATNLMINKYGVSSDIAGEIVFILPFGTVLLTPIIGYFIDRKGKGASIMILGSILLVLVHLVFAFLPGNIYFALGGMFILGVAFSLVPSALWPAVPKIVPDQYLGSAFAMIFWVQNIGLWLFPMLIGSVREWSNPGVSAALQEGKDVLFDYTAPMFMLVLVGVVALLFAILLRKADASKGYGLELPNERK